MKRTFYLPLLCGVVLLGVATAQAQMVVVPESPQSGAVADPSVARIAYLEDKVANLESTLQNGQGNCDSCREEACGNLCRPALCGNPGLIGGYDFVWLKPHFTDGVSYVSEYDTGALEIDTVFGYPTEYEFVPRFWLGYQGRNGLGVRVRYWQFDHKLMEETIAAGANTTLYFQTATATEGEDLEFTTGLEMHVLDVDITKDFEWHCAKLTAGAGLRYAKIAFDTDGRVYDGTDVVEWVESEHSFEGVGPTVFVNFKAPIRQSALSVVGGLRGSVLFGRGRGVGVVVDDVEETLYAELGNGNTTTGAIEGDLGLQYDRTLTNGVDGFVRVAWEGQLWFEVGSPTTDYGDMGMEGLSFSFGITR